MDNKLIQLLKTFSPKEFISFGKFVNSPFHNESELLTALYVHLKNYFPGFSSDELTKENVFRNLYGRERYNDKKLRDRFSDMIRLAEKFLAISHLQKNPVNFKMQTLYEYSARDLKIHFDRTYNDIRSGIDSIKFKNERSFYDEYLLEGERMGFYENKKLLGKRKPYFNEVAGHMDIYMRHFVTNMLRFYSIMNNIKGIVNYRYENRLYEPVMKYIDENNFEQYPLIRALRLMIKINGDFKDIDSYYKLKDLYLKNHPHMDSYDKMMITTELFIHSNIRQRAGARGFEKEHFEIIKLQLEHKAYPLEKGWMKREQFLVTVDAAANCGEVDWAEKFIDAYHNEIVPAQRENSYHWAKGFLYYKRKNYNKALTEFAKMKIGDHFYYFRAKVAVSKVYFELGEIENLFMVVDSVRHYIASNPELPQYVRLWNTCYINILNRLAGLVINYEDYKMDKLIEEIKRYSANELGSKVWLLEKALELKKKS
jgi:hypothetical protein